MSNKALSKTKGLLGRNRIRFSIVYKLNLQLWLRLLLIFLTLDIILAAAFFVTVVIYGEQMAAEVTAEIINIESVDAAVESWPDIYGIQIDTLLDGPRGFTVPVYFRDYLPQQTAQAARRLIFSGEEAGTGFLKQLKQLTYRVEFAQPYPGYGLSVNLRPLVDIFYKIMLTMLIIQSVILIQSIFTQARTIRGTLKPITELADKAHSLNVERGPFTPEEMQALAGKLDGINAARLDTRIELGATQDELKNLAVAINGMLDRINEAYRSQARFVSDASHELRTPIAAIQGYANLLDRWGKYDEKALQESIDAIKEEAANMKELIEQLLFLARGDNHRMHLEFEQFDLAEIAEAVIKETEMISQSHDITAELNSVLVVADMGLIKQALRILVDNAVKYTPVGGKIVISVDEKQGNACLTVQDDGIGIPAEAVPYIFDRFYRADESRARKTGGTGLGLSIARWIAQRHGGYMEVLSREEIGTRIGIIIPALKEQEEL